MSSLIQAFDTNPARRATQPLLLRALLLVGMAAAVGAVMTFSSPSVTALADPGLARLLRGMALIKAVITLGAAAAVLWRLGRSASAGVMAVYMGSVWVMTSANTLIWQFNSILWAAASFHAALIVLLLTAWREDRAVLGLAWWQSAAR